MNTLVCFFIVFSFFSTHAPVLASQPQSQLTPEKIKALYNSLDPQSVAQHLAFYHLYPEFNEGKRALNIASQLLSGSNQSYHHVLNQLSFPHSSLEFIVELVNKQPNAEAPLLKDSELEVVHQFSQRLLHHRLKGHKVRKEAEVIALNPDDVDLARGLFLSQLGEDELALKKIHSYEALIDLMALQILAKIEMNSSAESKIRAINQFIFDEMGFRFPPHSLYAKDIDLYTFLPSVLDSRRGVCLGVSILYLCLAQRLGLPLEVITPPGHIFVRYIDDHHEINIETTARGIHLDTEEYLGVDTRSLEKRNIKEVIGLAHFNQASVYWKMGDYQKSLNSYLIAQNYLPQDMLLKELMGYTYLMLGNEKEGKRLLEQVKDYLPDYATTKNFVPIDFLNGNTDVEGIKTIFMSVDENRDSVLEKQKALENIIKRYPKFRAGLLNLAITWLQLHRVGEALEVLKQYHMLEPQDSNAEYYLSVLYAERYDYNKAWEHLHQTEKLVHQRQHHPKALIELRRELTIRCPE